MSNDRNTMDDVAATLMGEAASIPEEPTIEEEILVPSEGIEVADEIVEDEIVEEEPIEEVVEEDDEEDEPLIAGDTDPEPYLDVTDEDLIEVKVDGEVVYRSIADAKKALSLQGATEQRLHEATTARNAARDEEARGIREMEARRDQLIEATRQLDQFVFSPSVALPDRNLQVTDPNGYISQMNAYQADQMRISQGRQQLEANMNAQKEQQAQNYARLRQENERVLVQMIPELADTAKAPVIMQEILQVGRSAGFNDAEIAERFDARAYKMAYDNHVMRTELARIKGKARVEPKKVVAVSKNQPRRLRSGVAVRNAAATQKAKARAAVTNKARNTGKVDDVLQTLFR